MNRYIVKIGGYRLTVSSTSAIDAWDEAVAMFPFARCASVRPL